MTKEVCPSETHRPERKRDRFLKIIQNYVVNNKINSCIHNLFWFNYSNYIIYIIFGLFNPYSTCCFSIACQVPWDQEYRINKFYTTNCICFSAFFLFNDQMFLHLIFTLPRVRLAQWNLMGLGSNIAKVPYQLAYLLGACNPSVPHFPPTTLRNKILSASLTYTHSYWHTHKFRSLLAI